MVLGVLMVEPAGLCLARVASASQPSLADARDRPSDVFREQCSLTEPDGGFSSQPTAQTTTPPGWVAFLFGGPAGIEPIPVAAL